MDHIAVLKSWPTWPNYSEVEKNAVVEVISSNQLFAAGRVKSFEREFADYLGVENVIGMGNATQALHLALAACEIGEGDEVIVTNCSWISTASCILMQNAVPVFVDIESKTLGPDPKLVEKAITPFTKAIITVHILGYPSRIAELREIATKHGLILIEDASHAPGAKLNGKKLGTFGDISVFSFHQRKAISAGEGGVACTDNKEFADHLRKMRSFGDSQLSYNYRMTEFSAALASIGLERIEAQNQMRKQSAITLSNLLREIDWVKVRLCDNQDVGSYYAIALEINLSDSAAQEIVRRMISRGVPMRSMFPPLNRHPHFNQRRLIRGEPWNHPSYKGEMKGINYSSLSFPVSYEFCEGRVLELYTHPGVTEQHLVSFTELLKKDFAELSPGNLRERWMMHD